MIDFSTTNQHPVWLGCRVGGGRGTCMVVWGGGVEGGTCIHVIYRGGVGPIRSVPLAANKNILQIIKKHTTSNIPECCSWKSTFDLEHTTNTKKRRLTNTRSVPLAAKPSGTVRRDDPAREEVKNS